MMTIRSVVSIAAVGLCFGSANAAPDVVDSSAAGFTVRHSVLVSSDQDKAFRAIINDVGKWWHPDHTWSGKSANLSIDARANGCFCERLDAGGSSRHLIVVNVEPPKVIRFAGGLGPLQTMAVSGSLTIALSPSGGKTKIDLTYTVGGYRPGGLQSLAGAVDGVLGVQIKRLARYIEKGSPE